MPMALGYKEKYLKQKTTYHRPVDESYGYVDEAGIFWFSFDIIA
jgi:hypothetical protein